MNLEDLRKRLNTPGLSDKQRSRIDAAIAKTEANQKRNAANAAKKTKNKEIKRAMVEEISQSRLERDVLDRERLIKQVFFAHLPIRQKMENVVGVFYGANEEYDIIALKKALELGRKGIWVASDYTNNPPQLFPYLIKFPDLRCYTFNHGHTWNIHRKNDDPKHAVVELSLDNLDFSLFNLLK